MYRVMEQWLQIRYRVLREWVSNRLRKNVLQHIGYGSICRSKDFGCSYQLAVRQLVVLWYKRRLQERYNQAYAPSAQASLS